MKGKIFLPSLFLERETLAYRLDWDPYRSPPLKKGGLRGILPITVIINLNRKQGNLSGVKKNLSPVSLS
jgi:hypothetical protein